jgi:hypothetical protein
MKNTVQGHNKFSGRSGPKIPYGEVQDIKGIHSNTPGANGVDYPIENPPLVGGPIKMNAKPFDLSPHELGSGKRRA